MASGAEIFVRNRNGCMVAPHFAVLSETETAYFITSLPLDNPQCILRLSRDHWKIEAMHRDKDVTLDEDSHTNRSGCTAARF